MEVRAVAVDVVWTMFCLLTGRDHSIRVNSDRVRAVCFGLE